LLLKIAVSVSTILVFIGMPLAVVLWPVMPWVARLAMRAFAVCVAVPVLWALCFAASAAVSLNALSFNDHGFVNTLVQPLVAIVLLWATTPVTAEETRVRRLQRAFTELLTQKGADTEYARRLPDLLRALGLRDVAGEGRMAFGVGASAAATVYKSGFVQLGDQMVDAGLCTRIELKTALELLDDPDCGFAMPLLISAWGRRPAALA